MTIDTPKSTHLPQLKHLWLQAFGDSEKEIQMFFEKGFSPERCRIVSDKDAVLGALYWFSCQWEGKPVAYLYAIATASAYRKQGVCTRLMEDTHRHLAALGFAGAVLVPGNPGLFSFYERLGYRPFGGMAELSVIYGNVPLPIKAISAPEYAALRKALLPAGSILQERDFLPLLDASLDFYTGDGWLLAGRYAWQHFNGAEYLGCPEKLPGILCALNASSGVFRCPGGTLPFAMYRSFTENAALPGYFAFALD